jgi:hypothetical protein
MYRLPHRPGAYDDDWEDVPAQGGAAKWVAGGVLPAGLLGCAVFAVVRRSAWLPGGRAAAGTMLQGADAVALGVAVAGIAVFLHCHYFWGNVYHLAFGATVGKVAGLVGMIGGLGYLLVNLGIYGR